MNLADALAYYKALGLPPPTTDSIYSISEVRRAYKRKAFECHPDKKLGCEAQFTNLNIALEALSDELKKTEIDSIILSCSLKCKNQQEKQEQAEKLKRREAAEARQREQNEERKYEIKRKLIRPSKVRDRPYQAPSCPDGDEQLIDALLNKLWDYKACQAATEEKTPMQMASTQQKGVTDTETSRSRLRDMSAPFPARNRPLNINHRSSKGIPTSFLAMDSDDNDND